MQRATISWETISRRLTVALQCPWLEDQPCTAQCHILPYHIQWGVLPALLQGWSNWGPWLCSKTRLSSSPSIGKPCWYDHRRIPAPSSFGVSLPCVWISSSWYTLPFSEIAWLTTCSRCARNCAGSGFLAAVSPMLPSSIQHLWHSSPCFPRKLYT